MKKLILTFALTILVIISIYSLVHNNYEIEDLKVKNLGDEYLNISIDNIQKEQGNAISNLVGEYDITYYYLEFETKKLFSDIEITTNAKEIIDINGNRLEDFCYSTKRNNNCNKIDKINRNNYTIKKGDEKFSNGIYYFKGVNLTDFGEQLSYVISEDDNTSSKLKLYYLKIYFLTFIFIITIFANLLFLVSYNFKNKLKYNILIISGYGKKRIIFGYTKRLFTYYFITLISSLIFLILFSSNQNKEIIFLFLISMLLIFMLLLVNFVIMILAIKDNIKDVINPDSEKKIYKIIIIIISIFSIICVLLFSFLLNNFIDNYKEYQDINHALNIRFDYGKFRGVSQGNDTYEYFTSQQFHNNEQKVTEEILPRIDYFYSDIGVLPGDNQKIEGSEINVIRTSSKYLDYNEIIKANQEHLTKDELLKDTCYYLIPIKYKESISLVDECAENKIIYLQNNQVFPSYQYQILYETKGLVTDPILIIYSKEYLDNNIASYDNIYYPIDDTGEVKDKDIITGALKKQGLLDNVLSFNTLQEDVMYNFLGIKIILQTLALVMLILFSVLIFLIYQKIKLYFEINVSRIVLLNLEGYSLLKIYRKFIRKHLSEILVELIIIIIFSNLISLSLFYTLISYLIVYILKFIIIMIIINKVNNLNINKHIKGEEL